MKPLTLTVKVPAIDKLIDYAAIGVGGIAGPLLAPWKASREGQARLIAAQADSDVRNVQARADANALSIIAEAQSEARAFARPSGGDVRTTTRITREDIAQSFEFQRRKRIANVRSVLEDTADSLGDGKVAEHTPDPDWTARFFDAVQDVSSGDMQKLWARILAGEVERPGRTSLRTLDTLRNMTKTDAERFSSACAFAIGDGIVCYEPRVVKGFPALKYGNMLHLEGCGLLNVSGNHAMNLSFGHDAHECLMRYQNGMLVITWEQSGRGEVTFPVKCVVLSSAGKELLQLTHRRPNMDYLRAFSMFLKERNCRLDYLSDVVEQNDGTVSYTNRIPLGTKPDPPQG